jgi:hypothetical protein
MSVPSLEERMDNLEKIVEPLRDLPDRVTKVEEQIVQLRTEIAKVATRDEMRMLHEDLVERLKVLGETWSRRKSNRRHNKTP